MGDDFLRDIPDITGEGNKEAEIKNLLVLTLLKDDNATFTTIVNGLIDSLDYYEEKDSVRNKQLTTIPVSFENDKNGSFERIEKLYH